MDLSIRRATPSDAQTLTRLYLRARRAGVDAGTIPPLVHDDEDVSGWMADVVVPTRDCWVAERGSEIVGMLVLEADWIDQLYVDPDLTGGGIGTQLMAVAKRERPGGLRLWTFVTNRGAQRF
jgi:GNAT superfamily N-acetyltransferase